VIPIVAVNPFEVQFDLVSMQHDLLDAAGDGVVAGRPFLLKAMVNQLESTAALVGARS